MHFKAPIILVINFAITIPKWGEKTMSSCESCTKIIEAYIWWNICSKLVHLLFDLIEIICRSAAGWNKYFGFWSFQSCYPRAHSNGAVQRIAVRTCNNACKCWDPIQLRPVLTLVIYSISNGHNPIILLKQVKYCSLQGQRVQTSDRSSMHSS
jgi:hypothetical protein